MIKLKDISFENEGKRISYTYDVHTSIAKYFNSKDSFYVEYDTDVSKTPLSIAVIPFLANIMPIAWFAGFEVHIDEVDATFEQSLDLLKEEFSKHFPNIKQENNLKAKTAVQNVFSGNKKALLFSGGLDSFESLTRNINDDVYLVSVLGADIEIDDKERWSAFKNFNSEEHIIDSNKIFYVTSNLRTFYTYKVDLLVNKGWWGQIQHGMALIAVIAPLSFVFDIRTILIASSNTEEVSFGWGSTSETDEKVKWSNLKTIHDGFQFRRTQKVENIIKFARETNNFIKLRVCYSEWRAGYNCNRCPKCQRTMLAFILAGENPNKYGFNTPSDLDDLILKNFEANPIMSTGVKYEWKCLQEKATSSTNYYKFKNEDDVNSFVQKFKNLSLAGINSKKESSIDTTKFIIRNKFPNLFKMYLLLRKKLNI